MQKTIFQIQILLIAIKSMTFVFAARKLTHQEGDNFSTLSYILLLIPTSVLFVLVILGCRLGAILYLDMTVNCHLANFFFYLLSLTFKILQVSREKAVNEGWLRIKYLYLESAGFMISLANSLSEHWKVLLHALGKASKMWFLSQGAANTSCAAADTSHGTANNFSKCFQLF